MSPVGGVSICTSCLFNNTFLQEARPWEACPFLTVLLGGGCEAGLREEQGTAAAVGMWEARLKQTCDHIIPRDHDAMFWSHFSPFP